MGTIKNFEDLDIWKLARKNANLVYKDYRRCKDYGFKDQIQRATVSVMNNISEGFCRNGNKEFHQFLKVAYASCGEVKNMYYLAEDLKYLSTEIAQSRRNEFQSLMNAIAKLMQYLRKCR